MENTNQDIERLRRQFLSCRKLLTALGDETRQHLLLMMLGGRCGGSRVAELAGRTNLSRPAVSHHIQILKDAGVVKARREGTYIYYYLDPDEDELGRMAELFQTMRDMVKNAPDRRGDDEQEV